MKLPADWLGAIKCWVGRIKYVSDTFLLKIELKHPFIPTVPWGH